MSEGNPLVCFALPDEVRYFKRTIIASRTRILIHGIGKQNAEHAIRAALANSKPSLILTCGFAGGLEPKLTHGEVLFEIDAPPITPPSGERAAELSVSLREKLISAGAKPGKFFCANRIAVTAEEKWTLWQKTGADAAEMESGVIHAICLEHGIPCATVRVISDIAGEDLPLDFNALAKPDQSIDFGRLALAIAKSPGKIPALLRLQKQTAAAAKKLAQILEAVV